MMPMRHVAYANTLTARKEPFAATALSELRRVWAGYVQCKRDVACRPTLCAAAHIADGRWTQSGLARACVADSAGAQWHVPSQPAGAGDVNRGGAAAVNSGRSVDVAGWQAIRRMCEAEASARRESALVTCVRSRWQRNLTTSLSLKQRKAIAAARAAIDNISAAGEVARAAPLPSTALKPTVVERSLDGRTFLTWRE